MTTDVDTFADEQQVVEQLQTARDKIDTELSKVIIGQREVIGEVLITLFAGGHCLLTGAPDSPRRCWFTRSRRSFI